MRTFSARSRQCRQERAGGSSVLLIRLADVLQSGDKIVQNLGRYHDAVAVGAHLFGDANNTASGIALQVDKEGFTIGNDFFGADDVVVHVSI